MNYLEWNDKLAAHFFNPEMAGREVFLYITQELLDDVGMATQADCRSAAVGCTECELCQPEDSGEQFAEQI